MKNFIKWTLIILTAASALAVGMYYLTSYFAKKDADYCDKSACKSGNSITKTFNRHYTKLNL